MGLTSILLYFVALLTALPMGYLLAALCRDELADGRKWFKLIIYCSVILVMGFLLFYRKLPIILSLIYLIILAGISIYLSKDKKFMLNKNVRRSK